MELSFHRNNFYVYFKRMCKTLKALSLFRSQSRIRHAVPRTKTKYYCRYCLVVVGIKQLIMYCHGPLVAIQIYYFTSILTASQMTQLCLGCVVVGSTHSAMFVLCWNLFAVFCELLFFTFDMYKYTHDRLIKWPSGQHVVQLFSQPVC